MGESRSEKLEFIPAQIKVIEHVRLTYSCRTCENLSTNMEVKIAPLPASLIPKAIATPAYLAKSLPANINMASPLAEKR